MNKLEFLIKSSLSRKFKSKSFIISNIILLVILVIGVNIDTIIEFFGGDFQNEVMVYLIDNANVYDKLKEGFTDAELSNYGIKNFSLSTDSRDKIEEEVMDDKNKIFLIVNDDASNYLSCEIISKEGVGTSLKSFLTDAINEVKRDIALKELGITLNDVDKINKSVNVEETVVSDNNEVENLLVASAMQVFILPLFMLIIYLVQMIGTEVNEEKSTRSMEIIISNVPAKTHFIAKVISANSFIFLQAFLLVIYAMLGLLIRFLSGATLTSLATNSDVSSMLEYIELNGVTDGLSKVIPLLLIMVLLTFIAYSLLAGVLASMTTSLEDFEQLQTPVVVILSVGYYLSVMAGMFDGSVFIKVMSYIPLISSMLMPTLYALGNISLLDVIISIILLLLMIFILIKYGFRIYKVGILNYDNTGLWKKIFKSVKEK